MQPGNQSHPIICADDFCYSHGVSQAILDLVRRGKVNATSVLVESQLTRHYAPLLTLFSQHIQIGLHFNLTESYSADSYSLYSLLLSPRLSSKTRGIIIQRLNYQLDLFEDYFGKPPDFIDGHQHVHILPVIRHLFFQVIKEHFKSLPDKPWVRQVSPRLTKTDAHIKVAFLRLLNCGFRALCGKNGFRYNEYFDGVYSLTSTADYETMLNAWIARSSSETLIMCHPARWLTDEDGIARARFQEYKVLSRLNQ